MPSKHLALKGNRVDAQETHKTLMNWETNPKLLHSDSPTQGPHAEGPGWKVPRIPWKEAHLLKYSPGGRGGGREGKAPSSHSSRPHLTHCLQKGLCTLLWSPDFCGHHQRPPLDHPALVASRADTQGSHRTNLKPLALATSEHSLSGALFWRTRADSPFFSSTTFPPGNRALPIAPSRKGEDIAVEAEGSA